MGMRRLAVGLVAFAVVGGMVTACSSKSGGSSGGSSSAGGDLKLFQIAPIQSTVVSAPYMQTSAEAAASAINDAGGINGRKVSVETCNDQFQAQEAIRCAQKAVTDPDVVAVVGSLSGYGPQIMPLFEKAKLPVIGSDVLAQVDGTSPMAFPIDTGVPGPDIAAPAAAKKFLNVDKIGVLQQDQAQTKINATYFDIGSKQAGVPVAKYITIPSDATDLSSYVTQARDAGITVLMSTVQAPQALAAWKAIGSAQLGIKLIASGSSVGQSLVSQAGALANGSYLLNGVPNPDTSNPTGQQYRSEMAKYQPSTTDFDGLGLRAWASVHLFADVAKTVQGKITRASFLPVLEKVHGMKFLWIDSLSFDKPGPIAELPRVVSTVIFPSVVRNAVITPLASFDPYGTGS